MKSNRLLALALATVMLFSLAACGSAPASSQTAPAPAPAETQAPAPAPAEAPAAAPAPAAAAPAEAPSELSDIDTQLKLIHDNMDKLQQPVGELPWFYTVTDLDHNGSLEFIAASQHPSDRSTNLKVWEVSKDRKALTECSVKKDEEESFPDIMTDSVDTFHVTGTDTWNYLFYDNIVLSDTEIYTSKSAFQLKDGVISYEAFAIEHTIVESGVRRISYTNPEGDNISQSEYNAAGILAFDGAERSNTSFEWLTAEDAKNITRLTDSCAVFNGLKKATEAFPVPKPAALQAPEATPMPAAPAATPAPTPVPDPQPAYLMITKNPTNETRKLGGTAMFVACANTFDSLKWVMVDPMGYEYDPATFGNVSGYYSTTLSVNNLTSDFNGWGAYCNFFYRGQTARTSTAYINIQNAAPTPTPVPVPDGGVYYGSVADWNYSTVSVNLDGTTLVALPWDICSVIGEIYYGAPATAYWNGTTTKGLNFTYCEIQGSAPEPTPQYGSMNGNAYEGGGGFAIYLADGSQVFVDGWKCSVSDNFYEGAPCIVYYTGSPTSDNIYQVSIFGSSYTEPEDDVIRYETSDGTTIMEWSDGSSYIENENGSYFFMDTDGTWAYYDASTGEVGGSFFE